MTRIVAWCVTALLASAVTSDSLRAEAAKDGPTFKEVFDLAHNQLPKVSSTELEHLAGKGLIAQLKERGLLIADAHADTSTPAIAASRVFDQGYAYVRLARVSSGAADDFQRALAELGSTNKLKGLAIDLRFANGHDYAAAANLADLFLTKAQTLFDVGEGSFRSHEKAHAISLHCLVLINHQTAMAAEALAAALREAGVGLLIGEDTAGRAKVWREFTLSDGSRVWLAGDPVRLGNGMVIPSSGVEPDIRIQVNAEEERKYVADPYYESAAERAARTQTPQRQRLNEAELVREHNGVDNDGSKPGAEAGAPPAPPQVRDPVLARALDLLKGLAVVGAHQAS